MSICEMRRGWTPLFYALRLGRFDIAEYLCDHRADVNTIDEDGNTLLDNMFGVRLPEQIAWLKRKGVSRKAVLG